ncbi:N-acetylglucosamine-1-phosphotransferase subunit gamma [Apodemus speciosus]|uniref:N-acetylglucosamine-1-phosphotransferase subunit gamma n=1 Tax=Apodemus speciosus TaxID=105296 RepID=A0ABQ0FN94_APOSI
MESPTLSPQTTHSQHLGQQLPIGAISEQLRGDPGLHGNIL